MGDQDSEEDEQELFSDNQPFVLENETGRKGAKPDSNIILETE